MKNLSLKMKILLIMTPLILLALALGGSLLYQFYIARKDANTLMTSAKAQMALSAVIHEIQRERGMSSLYLNKDLSSDELGRQRDKVNGLLSTFKKEVAEVTFSDKDSELRKFEKLLEDARAVVMGSNNGKGFFDHFVATIANGITLQLKLFENARYEGIESSFTSLTIFEESKESMGKLRAVLTSSFAGNIARSMTERDEYSKFLSGIVINLASPGLKISNDGKKKAYDVLESNEWKNVVGSYKTFNEKYSEGSYGIDAKAFNQSISNRIDAVYNIVVSEQQLNLETLTKAAESANTKFILLAVALSVILVVVMYIAFYILNQLVRQFTTIGEKLREAGANLSAASLQIASSSEALSQAATEQASSLEETAASIEEMNSMVQKNAESAIRTSDLAVSSNKSADKGKSVVNDMIRAINDISVSNNTIMVQVDESNQQISDIVKVISEIGNKTKVINDIVFQTKLLSFNASVEAARAGEHGKGFAVVAEEVGNLAQMSGNAAKEISTMLDDSIKKVESIVNETKQKVSSLIHEGKNKVEAGSQIAKQCGDVLNEIVENISNVTQMANEISTACQEQSQGVQEITKAMNQLDQVTQSNAATSEQAASAAEELSSQADSLQGVVGVLVKVINGDKSSSLGGDDSNSSTERRQGRPAKQSVPNVVQIKDHKSKQQVVSNQSFKKASGYEGIPDENDPRFEDI